MIYTSRAINNPPIFASCWDCPPDVGSAETVRDRLLPAETTLRKKWLPTETVRVILLPSSRGGSSQEAICYKQ